MAELPPPPIYPAQGPYEVTNGMIACGCTVDQAPIVAMNVFGNTFTRTVTDDDVKDVFKSLGEMTPANRRIRLAPIVKRNIRAYNAWIKHIYRLGRSPAMEQFHPAQNTEQMLAIAAHMKRFTSEKSTTSSIAEPSKFTKDTDWRDWSPTVVNYFRMIAGNDGIPLSYVLRENEAPDPTPNPDFKDDYVKNAPLAGTSYVSDSREIHSAIRNLITGNTQAEAIIKPHETGADGRAAWMALKRHYEGVGIYSADIAKASHTLNNLYYAGEKDGRMWWTKFQTELDWAFATYTKKYGVNGQSYHPNEEKLKILLDKVNASFLTSVKAGIKVQLTINPNFPYEQACQAFRAEVNARNPQGTGSNQNRTTRHIRQTQSGRGSFAGRGAAGGFAKKIQQFNKYNSHDDEEMIKLKNGMKIKYHASFNYPDALYRAFPDDLKNRMRDERTAYKKKRKYRRDEEHREVKEIHRKLDDLTSVVSQITKKSSSNESRISEITTNTPFGGRSEQSAFKRKRSDTEDS